MEATRTSRSGLALPERDQHEDNCDDDQAQMADGCPGFGEQIVGLRLGRDETGEGRKKQHAPRIVAPADKNVIRITSRADSCRSYTSSGSSSSSSSSGCPKSSSSSSSNSSGASV